MIPAAAGSSHIGDSPGYPFDMSDHLSFRHRLPVNRRKGMVEGWKYSAVAAVVAVVDYSGTS
jgi:hypothetical protein